LPYGVGEGLQIAQSNLVDAYKKCELENKSNYHLFKKKFYKSLAK
jgi:hypothetical protein